MPKPHIAALLKKLSAREREILFYDWRLWAREEQLPPSSSLWTTWLFLGGRGAGKTRAGAEWVRCLASSLSPIALVGESFADVREVMVEGLSGILAVHPRRERPKFEKSRNRLVWQNGAIANLFSASDPESLRGPQFAAAWCDELAKWRYADATWDNLQFGLRVGKQPRQLVTTTPRPIPLLKRLMSDPHSKVTHASTFANADNLASSFLQQIVSRYEGTSLGRQELNGEIIEDETGALFVRSSIEQARVQQAPELSRVVVAVDPAVTSGKKADACGLIIAGLTREGDVYVLEDATLHQARPDIWAAHVVKLYHQYQADAVIVEVNQGGDVIQTVLATIDDSVAVQSVRATRGKWLRAEPVAALYAKGIVHHVGVFAALEDEMCSFTPDGRSRGHSPDRLDALVWAITALKLTGAAPSMRRL